ncbi:hypothetical protein QCM8_276 [Bacillus phage QCM8]|nr:hypothetical protein QCM8_276 [Bacillus phage QCM8]
MHIIPIVPSEQMDEYDELVKAYMNVLTGVTPLNKVSGVYTLMENYCEKYNTTFNEISRDVHLAAIMTLALQDKK